MRAVVIGMLVCFIGFVGQVCAQEDADMHTAPVAAIRVAYLTAEGVPVHVVVGGTTMVPPTEPASVTGFRLLPSGTSEIRILDASEAAAGGLGPATAPILAHATGAFEPGRYYTLILTASNGEGANVAGESEQTEATLAVRVIEDRLDAFAGPGEAWIRMVNLLPGHAAWSALGTRVVDDRAPRSRGSGDASDDVPEIHLATGQPFAEAGEWTRVPIGIYDVRFETAAGAGALPQPLEVAFHGGTLYTAFVYPGPADEPPRVEVRVDAVVRATAGPVPVWPGGRP